ncbi:MAG: SH3 domain-containing protein [Chloroflexi bacterium]|nr:SH3 domain-containing protein [Chloroflexota bacterium]
MNHQILNNHKKLPLEYGFNEALKIYLRRLLLFLGLVVLNFALLGLVLVVVKFWLIFLVFLTLFVSILEVSIIWPKSENHSSRGLNYSVLFIASIAVLLVGVVAGLGYYIIKPSESLKEAIIKVSTPTEQGGISSILPTLTVTPTPIPIATPIVAQLELPTVTAQPPIDTSTPMPTVSPSSTPSATSTPIGLPLPTSTPEAVVVANELNLRSGPGTTYAAISVLPHGDDLEILARIPSNEWIQVVPVSGDALGWVAAAPEYVRINVDLNSIPIITPPPSPPPPTPPPISVLASPGYKYPAPKLTDPDNGVGTLGAFPPLFWKWDGELKEDEYFEVRVWHEDLPYHAALGWVKQPQFDINVSGERNGKFYWTVVIVQGKNPRLKDWIQPGWPYPVWDGELVRELSPEAEPRFFFFTSSSIIAGSSASPISRPPAR